MKGQPFFRRLGFAWNGLKSAVARESSFRIHLAVTACVLLVLLSTRPPFVWWAIVAMTIGFVLVAELFNAALETLIDHLHPAVHPEIGIAKDLAAAAVLVASLIAVVVGLVFLLDRLVP
ncbi:MAG: diacylglycerol kinase [Burkholderiaceae bacterium]